MTLASMSPAEAVQRCQAIFAHAWMVRTFVKHSPEVEEFPELMHVARTIFDVSRSLESRVNDPAAYLKQLRKKFRRMCDASDRFRQDAPLASSHTNFQQAVVSMEACIQEWERILRTLDAVPIESPSRDPGSAVPLTATDQVEESLIESKVHG